MFRVVMARLVSRNRLSGVEACRSPASSTGGCARGSARRSSPEGGDLTSHHLYKIETGKRGCIPETAQLLADVLQVDLEDLRRRREDAPRREGAPQALPRQD